MDRQQRREQYEAAQQVTGVCPCPCGLPLRVWAVASLPLSVDEHAAGF